MMKATSLKLPVFLIVTLLMLAMSGRGVEVGPVPEPPDHEWTYVLQDIDEDGEEDKIGFLSRDYHIFGSLFRPAQPDKPPYVSGDYVGLYYPQYTVTSNREGMEHTLLHYHITDKHSPDSVSPGGGTIVTRWSGDSVELTRTVNLNTERCLMEFTIRNTGAETLQDVGFMETHGFDDRHYVFNGDEYPGGQLIGMNMAATRGYPVFGMVYSPVPDSLEIPVYAEARYNFGDLQPDETKEVILSIVWSTSSNPSLAKEQVVSKMVEQKEILRNVPAMVDCNPNTINLKSEGRWITCHIELFEGHNPREIYADTIRLNDVLAPEQSTHYGFVKSEESYKTDRDKEGIHKIMVKFNRADVVMMLTVGESVSLVVSGELKGGLRFAAEDFVKVISPP